MSNLFYELISDNAGKRLKYERESWGMSRRKLAGKLKIEPETIEYIENGYVCMLDFNLLRNICEILDVNPFDFFKRKLSTSEIVELM